MPQFVIAAFYQFVALPDYRELRNPLLTFCDEQQIKGSVLLAAEGINGTIAGTRKHVDAVLAFLRQDARLSTMLHKESFADYIPFDRMKVRLKKEIVNLGKAEINPNDEVGTYVDPADWNALISDPEVVLIDTRNDYEVDIGTFQGAINPNTQSFNQFPQFVTQQLDPRKQKKVAMFCTGGIRCEKATAYMLQLGFEEVYHLKGGILNYLQHIPSNNSMWNGDCFVFDKRIAVNHALAPGDVEICFHCQAVISPQDKLSDLYELGVYCLHCYPTLSEKQRASAKEKIKQLRLAKDRQKREES
ncbi:MAG: rhodanese-related sulfurtransferase [Chloroflexi bacterium]|nr:MAG: rhodanese-related sulfurtransferase [Chloroflexota bacterium]